MEEKKWTIQSIGVALNSHIALDKARDEKINRVFETVVTGNGDPPLKQEVHDHKEWIANANRFLWIGITAIVGALVTGAISLTVIIVRIYPLLEQIKSLEAFK